LREDLRAMFAAAVAAGEPGRLTAEHLRADPFFKEDRGEALLVVAAGKAAAPMAAAAESALAGRRLIGVAVAPQLPAFDLEHVRIAVGRHPVPDENGEKATAEVCELLSEHAAVPLLCLLSGGASSLLVQPRPPVSLDDKRRVTELLLRSGADIEAMNTVRKHLSTVKGGGLLRFGGPRRVLTLMISDVVGNDPSVIGSGPTSADPTTFAAAQRVLREWSIAERVPASVARLLADGAAGRVPETVKPGAPELSTCRGVIVGDNRTALAGAATAARQRGYFVLVERDALSGDTATAARAWWDRVARLAASAPAKQPWCMISGGETTVRVRGRGRGGRNQEFALALVARLRGCDCVVLSAGTDGIDGPTDAAGAFVTGGTAERAAASGLDPDRFLAANDSYTFFAALGDLHRCGATGTNLMDIKIAAGPSAPPRATRAGDSALLRS